MRYFYCFTCRRMLFCDFYSRNYLHQYNAIGADLPQLTICLIFSISTFDMVCWPVWSNTDMTVFISWCFFSVFGPPKFHINPKMATFLSVLFAALLIYLRKLSFRWSHNLRNFRVVQNPIFIGRGFYRRPVINSSAYILWTDFISHAKLIFCFMSVVVTSLHITKMSSVKQIKDPSTSAFTNAAKLCCHSIVYRKHSECQRVASHFFIVASASSVASTL